MNNADINAVLSLLAEEQDALKKGEFDRLSQLASQKEACTSALSDMRLTQSQADKLRREADKTARLLAAAIAGMKDAQARLMALKDTRDGLSVYTAGGARENVATPSRDLEHKL